MAVNAQFIPDSPEAQETVLAVFREHPELREFIQRSVNKAAEVFPNVSVQLDTIQYEPSDPPVTLTLGVIQPLSEFSRAYDDFVGWLVTEPGFEPKIIHVFPVWHGSRDLHQ